jgi:hypothetical protein
LHENSIVCFSNRAIYDLCPKSQAEIFPGFKKLKFEALRAAHTDQEHTRFFYPAPFLIRAQNFLDFFECAGKFPIDFAMKIG